LDDGLSSIKPDESVELDTVIKNGPTSQDDHESIEPDTIIKTDGSSTSSIQVDHYDHGSSSSSTFNSS
jgi:hypothetical protein